MATKEEIEQRRTGEEIAKIYGVDEGTVRNWRHQGMPHIKYSSRMYRYELPEVEAWLKARGLKKK
jgi:transposase-like protein